MVLPVWFWSMNNKLLTWHFLKKEQHLKNLKSWTPICSSNCRREILTKRETVFNPTGRQPPHRIAIRAIRCFLSNMSCVLARCLDPNFIVNLSVAKVNLIKEDQSCKITCLCAELAISSRGINNTVNDLFTVSNHRSHNPGTALTHNYCAQHNQQHIICYELENYSHLLHPANTTMSRRTKDVATTLLCTEAGFLTILRENHRITRKSISSGDK